MRGAVTAHLQLAGRLPAFVLLPVELAVARHLDPHVGGERVDDGGADAMEPAGDFIGLAVELAAGVQVSHDGLEGRLTRTRVLVDRDAAPVVGDADAAVGHNHDVDAVAEAGHRLVDGVIDDLVDEVMQPALIGRSDVHAGAAADGLEAFEDLNIGSGVSVFGFRH